MISKKNDKKKKKNGRKYKIVGGISSAVVAALGAIGLTRVIKEKKKNG